MHSHERYCLIRMAQVIPEESIEGKALLFRLNTSKAKLREKLIQKLPKRQEECKVFESVEQIGREDRDPCMDFQVNFNPKILSLFEKEPRFNISPQDVQKMREEEMKSHKFVDKIAIGMGFIDRAKLLKILSEVWKVPIANLNAESIDRKWGNQYPSKKAFRKHWVIPIGSDERGHTVKLAMAYPIDLFAQEDIYLRTGFKVEPYLALPSEIGFWLNQLFPLTEGQ